MTIDLEHALRAALAARAGQITAELLRPAAPPTMLPVRHPTSWLAGRSVRFLLAAAAVLLIAVIVPAQLSGWGPHRRTPQQPASVPPSPSAPPFSPSAPSPSPSLDPSRSLDPSPSPNPSASLDLSRNPSWTASAPVSPAPTPTSPAAPRPPGTSP